MLLLAKRLNRLALYLFYLACVVFLVAGTLGSLEGATSFTENALVEKVFRLAPFYLVMATMPLSIITGLCLRRLNIMHIGILRTVFLSAAAFTLLPLFFKSVPGWVAAAAWVGVIYMLKVNITRFEQYLAERTQQSAEHTASDAPTSA